MNFCRRFVLFVNLGSALALTGYTAGPNTGKIKVLLDTDIGSDIDDAIALTYLLAEPRCELLGITTVTGHPEQRAEMASALCRAAGRMDIPIRPGADQPLVIAQRQPDVPQYAALGDRPRQKTFPHGEAIELLRRTIRANPGEVTLLAIGPLTNIALLFRTDPEIPGMLKELVLMCGQFGEKPVRWGNKEWNAMLDPEATAIVFKSAPPRLRSYGLDVTLQLVMPKNEVARHFETDPRLQLVLALAQVWFVKQNEIYFHDPLAAVSIFHPDVCGMQRGSAAIVLADGEDKGRTLWTPEESGRQEVGVNIRADAFFQAYFKVFDKARR